MREIINPGKYAEQKNKILEFAELHEDKFMEAGIDPDMLILSFFLDFPSRCQSFNHVQYELLSKFGVVNKGIDLYEIFRDILKDRDLLRGRILEVGAGVYPRLSEVIREDNSPELVKVTACDPALIVDTMSGVKLVKEPFTKSTNLDDVDTLVGLFPCEASRLMVDRAIEENKNLLLAFCNCDHSDNEIYTKHDECWADVACEYYQKKYGDAIKVLSWGKNVMIDLPIIEYKAPQFVKTTRGV